MKRIYIASPYTIGDRQENVNRQIRCASILIDFGFAPYWPLSSHYLEQFKARAYDKWLELDFEWLRQCDAVLRLEGESSGADKEVALAGEIGTPVYYSIFTLIDGCC